VFGFWSKLSQQYKNAVEKSTTGACSVKHDEVVFYLARKEPDQQPYIIIIIIFVFLTKRKVYNGKEQ